MAEIRTLGAVERPFLVTDRHRPTHVVMTFGTDGTVTFARRRAGLRAVQARHELLSASIGPADAPDAATPIRVADAPASHRPVEAATKPAPSFDAAGSDDVETIGVATSPGRLSLMHASVPRIPPLLEPIEGELDRACTA